MRTFDSRYPADHWVAVIDSSIDPTHTAKYSPLFRFNHQVEARDYATELATQTGNDKTVVLAIWQGSFMTWDPKADLPAKHWDNWKKHGFYC